MDLPGDLVAGCAPGEPDCGAGSVPPGLDTWFLVLVVLVLTALVVGTAWFVRSVMARRAAAAANDAAQDTVV
jgi:hypothetical protein